MDFITFLKSRREQLGYSQNKFAKLVNITQSYFNSIERGEVKNPPSQDVLERIAEGLELNSEEKKQMFILQLLKEHQKLYLIL